VQVTKIAGLEPLVKLRELVLRSSLISKMEGLSTLTNLVHLELYDNQVEALEVSLGRPIEIR
jgi:Leucine-rich repeat (LRR) protein